MIKQLQQQFRQPGKLQWIGLRPGKGLPLASVSEVLADPAEGLQGDHYHGRSGKRQVTLIQYEHFYVIEQLTGQAVTPAMLRRNLVVAGINLLALNKQYFQIGDAVFLATGHCHPCSRMEKVLATGGYNAMRGHGGLTAQVVEKGSIRVGDEVVALPDLPI